VTVTVTLQNQKKHFKNDKQFFFFFFIKVSLILHHIRLFLILKTFKWRQKTASKTERLKRLKTHSQTNSQIHSQTHGQTLSQASLDGTKISFPTRFPKAFKKSRVIFGLENLTVFQRREQIIEKSFLQIEKARYMLYKS
jgi:hypothetical protein